VPLLEGAGNLRVLTPPSTARHPTRVQDVTSDLTALTGIDNETGDLTTGKAVEYVTGDLARGAAVEYEAGDLATEPDIEYVTGDLAMGAGIGRAARDVTTGLHLAGGSSGDVDKVRNLVQAVAPGTHAVFISVVGAYRVPVVSCVERPMFGHFADQLAAERSSRSPGCHGQHCGRHSSTS
jgi:hypothetical protein